MPKSKPQKSLQYCWILSSPLIIFLTSCDRIIATGERLGSPFTLSSQVADSSIWWLLPAGLLWLLTGAYYGEQVGYGYNGIVVIPGQSQATPEEKTTAANFVANLWLVAYPVAYFYYQKFSKLSISLTSFPNLDWVLNKIIFPLALLLLIIWCISKIRRLSSLFSESLIRGWQIFIGLASLNLLVWLLFLFIPWFFQLLVNFVSWLFQR